MQMVFLLAMSIFFSVLIISKRRKKSKEPPKVNPRLFFQSLSLTLLNIIIIIIIRQERAQTHTHAHFHSLDFSTCFFSGVCVPSRKKHRGWIEKNKMDGWMRSKKETARALLQAKIHRKIKNRKNKSEISNRKIKSGNEKDDHVPRSFFSIFLSLITQTHNQKRKNPKKRFKSPFFFFSFLFQRFQLGGPGRHYITSL